MDFQEFEDGTEETNIYSQVIHDYLEPIRYWLGADNASPLISREETIDRVQELEDILNVTYALLGYAGEIAEIQNKFKKVLRGDYPLDIFIGESFAEQGDGLYYAAQLAKRTGYSLEQIAVANNKKLTDRMKRGAIRGDGDHR